MAAIIPKFDPNPTLGPAFVGLVATSVLYGVTILQTFLYYVNFDDDAVSIKLLVAFLWALDTVHLIMVAHFNYFYLVKNWGIVPVQNVVVWSLSANLIFTTVIAIIVQGFLIVRVWRLSARNWFLTSFLSVLALLAFSSGTAYAIRLYILGRISLSSTILNLIHTSLGSTLVVDVCITISLVYFLHRSRTGVPRTEKLITSLILYSVTTGLITSLIALLDVIFHSALPKTTAFETFYDILSKLYVNTLMATLNARLVLRHPHKPQSSKGPAFPSLRAASGSTTQIGISPFSHELESIPEFSGKKFDKGQTTMTDT